MNEPRAGGFLEADKVSIEGKLQSCLELANEMCSLAYYIADKTSIRLQAEWQALKYRDSVCIGLAAKMYNSFECLVEDAKAERLEAMHHLKTLVETFIYFHWVVQDPGEKRARLVVARSVDETVRFYRKNPGYVEQAVYKQWEKSLRLLTSGLESEWEDFKKTKRQIEELARDLGVNIEEWYQRIYRLACGPAHIGDLLDYMPNVQEAIRLGKTPTSHLRAIVALDYGLQILCDLLKAASDFFQLELEEKIRGIEDRYVAMRGE